MKEKIYRSRGLRKVSKGRKNV